MDGLSDGVILLDRTGAFQLMSPAAEVVLPMLKPQMDGKKLVALGELRLSSLIEDVLKGSTRAAVTESRNAASHPQSFNLVLSPACTVDGQVTGVWLLLRNVSQERDLQSQLWQLTKLSSIGQLVSGVAHELNNSLTAVLGYAQIMQRDRRLDEQHLDAMRQIAQEADRARRIVQNLLSVARGNKSAKMRVQLNDVLDQILDLRAYDLRVSGIEVERALSPDLPMTMGDAQLLRQVFLSVINNAADMMQAGNGGGHLLVESRSVGDRVEIAITDSGPGVSSEHARKIFDPFFTTKPRGHATGLGLSVSYDIMSQHGGAIYLRNPGSSGATFVMDFPAVPAPEDRGAVG